MDPHGYLLLSTRLALNSWEEVSCEPRCYLGQGCIGKLAPVKMKALVLKSKKEKPCLSLHAISGRTTQRQIRKRDFNVSSLNAACVCTLQGYLPE